MTAAELIARTLQLFEPPPDLLVSEWADEFRRLSPEASAEPGEFRIAKTPYMREFVDCYNDPDVEEVIIQKSSQVAYTENLNNILGYIAHQRPGPTMLMQPTLQMGEAYSKERITTMVRDTPCLSRLIDERARKGGNTILNKAFPGGFWQFVGANSPASLASRPIRDFFVDEWDRAPHSAGKEGTPDRIGEARQITFFDRKRFKGGTPTIKGASRTVKGFKSGDQRHYHVPCPRCGDHVPLIRNRLQMDPVADHYAEYRCQSCDGWIKEHERFDMIRDEKAGGSARWVPHAECPAGRRSYFIWAIYSPWKSWRSMCDAWNEAKGDPEEEQVITNTLFGEDYEFATVELDHEELFKQREDYDGQRLPDAVEVITAGVDTQDDRFEVEVVGWGQGEESWSIEFFTVPGDPSLPETRAELDRFLQAVYQREDGREMQVSAAFVDSGGHRTDAVYDFTRGKSFRHIFACKGSSVVGQPVFIRLQEQKKAKVKIAGVGTDTAKEAIYARLAKGSETTARMHFPLAYSKQYFSGLTAEEKIVTWKSGTPRVEWKKRAGVEKSRNEPLDCRVYALAALRSLPMAVRRLRRKEKAAAKQAKAPAPAATEQPAAPVQQAPAPVEKPKAATKRATEPHRRQRKGGWWG
jgi:phage terminase large subunit GpA-like protein